MTKEPRKRYRVQITRTYWASGTVDVESISSKAASKAALASDYEIDGSLSGSEEDEVTEVELFEWQCACGVWNNHRTERFHTVTYCSKCAKERPSSLRE